MNTHKPDIVEKAAPAVPGGIIALLLLLTLTVGIAGVVFAIVNESATLAIAAAVALVLTLVGALGFFIVSPNEAIVLQLFGSYLGTMRSPGLWWTNPLSFPRHPISQRIRNFESSKLKVNDHDGNPIEIAAVVVWNVVDTAEAMFQVDDYENFVRVQSEAAIRNMATSYPYDSHIETEVALRRNSAEVTEKLRAEVQERLAKAGIHVIEARISHLAYAQEIAGAMLRRQQASAIVAARVRIVEGAVGMVEMALDELSKKNVVHLDEERKAAMVSNLLVVLCSDQHTQPVVNAGTLYQ